MDTPPQTTRRFIVIRFAIDSSATCDQAPETDSIEPVLDSINDACKCPLPVDRVAIINFEQPIQTGNGNVYFILSPRSTNPQITPTLPSPYSVRRHLKILQGKLHPRLDGPNYFADTPHLPPSMETMMLDRKTAHHGGDVCVMCVSLAKSLQSGSFPFPPERTSVLSC